MIDRPPCPVHMGRSAVTRADPGAGAWQRLSPVALVFLIVRALQKFIRENLVVFLGAGASVAFVERLGMRELLLGASALFLIIVVTTAIYHRRFRFRVEEDAVRVRRGVLEHKELRIRFSRVQNVQLGEPVYFRPFGLVQFSLETPGAAEREVELPGIPRRLAEEIRDRIVGARAAVGADNEVADELAADEAGRMEQGADAVTPVLLHAPGVGRLFVHGLSSNQVWVVAGVVVYALDLVFRQTADSLAMTQLVAWLETQFSAGWSAVLPLLAGVLAALLAAGGAAALLRFHPYRLHDYGQRLVGSGGVLERREQTLRRDKLTGVVLQQSPVGRLLGCWVLAGLQTRSDGRGNEVSQRSFLVPGLRAADRLLVGRLYPGAVVPAAFEPIHMRYRSWWLGRGFLVVAGVLGALLATLGREHAAILPLTVLLVLLPPLVWLRWRQWGWWLDRTVIWVRRGLFGQRLEAFELARVQQVQLRSSPYLRRHGLVTLVLVLPQGLVQLPFMAEERAAALANQALFAAETALRHRV